MRDIKRLYNIYMEEKNESDRLDDLWEQDPENEILEAAWDDAYTRYFNRAWELAERVYNVDIYAAKDNDETPETLAQAIREKPRMIISFLLDYIDEKPEFIIRFLLDYIDNMEQ